MCEVSQNSYAQCCRSFPLSIEFSIAQPCPLSVYTLFWPLSFPVEYCHITFRLISLELSYSPSSPLPGLKITPSLHLSSPLRSSSPLVDSRNGRIHPCPSPRLDCVSVVWICDKIQAGVTTVSPAIYGHEMRHVIIEFQGPKVTTFPLFTFFPHFPSLLHSHPFCPTSVLCTSYALLLLLSSVLSLFSVGFSYQ
jgi:hypothetical protein